MNEDTAQRIATALEQIALEMVKGKSTPEAPSLEVPWPTEPPAAEALPPISPAYVFTPLTACPVHHQAWKQVPAGVSKRTGQAYSAFMACPERGCTQRPAA